MKRLLSVIISLCMIFSAVYMPPLTAHAETDGDFEYKLVSGNAEILKYNGTASNLVIPDTLGGATVMYIAMSAFQDNTALTSVTLPDTLNWFGDLTFAGCTNLTSLHIPASCTSVGANAFVGCTSLTAFTVESGNTVYCAEDGVLYYITKSTLIAYPAGKADTSFTVPDGVESIRLWAFDGCKYLQTVNLPDSVKEIDSNAFENCKALTTVNMKNNVTTIGEEAFAGCTSLTDITLSERLAELYPNVFKNCTGLKTLNLPESVEAIYDGALSGCSGLKEISLSSNLYTVCASAFGGCTALIKVNYNATVEEWEYLSKSIEADNEALLRATVICTDGVISGDSKTFVKYDGKEGETEFVLPDEVTEIAEGAFENAKLETIYLSPNTQKIGAKAFANCGKLEVVAIPETVTSIDDSCIDGCNTSRLTIVGPASDDAIKVAPLKASAQDEELIKPLKGYALGATAAEKFANRKKVKYSSPLISPDPIPDQYYAGKPVVPSYSVYIPLSTGKKLFLKRQEDYNSKIKNNNKVGEATILIYTTGKFKSCNRKKFGYALSVGFDIIKRENPFKVKGKKINLMFTKLQKRSKKLSRKKLIKVTGAKGKVTYKKLKGNKNIKVKNDGRIIVKKGTKKGLYKVKIQVTAAGDAFYNPKTKTVKVKIKVK